MITNVLKDHIATTYMHGERTGLTETTPLLGLNIIDSSRLFELVHFIGSEFAVKIPFDQIVPENFESICAITTLIERIRASSGKLS
jgi:acyl carrier protein